MSRPTYRCELVFRLSLPKLQADSFRSWQKRRDYRKGWHKLVAEEIMIQRARPPEPLNKARIVCLRASRGPAPDYDNLVYSFKVVLDGLIKAHVLLDDSPGVLVSQKYSFEMVRPRKGFTKIKIVEDERNVRTEGLWD